jgi:hypothetical protein
MCGKSNGNLLYGVGVGARKYTSSISGKHRPEYQLWKAMLRRCYSEKERHLLPSYEGCTVSENFKSFDYFYEWCQEQVGFIVNGFALDKDILVKGNRVYSEDTCVFVPKAVNQLLITKNSCRGDYVIGVSFDKSRDKFVAKCGQGGRNPLSLGRFNTEIEAFLVYKKAKEAYIKQVAEQYKDVIDPRAYKALLEYEVNIED